MLEEKAEWASNQYHSAKKIRVNPFKIVFSCFGKYYIIFVNSESQTMGFPSVCEMHSAATENLLIIVYNLSEILILSFKTSENSNTKPSAVKIIQPVYNANLILSSIF